MSSSGAIRGVLLAGVLIGSSWSWRACLAAAEGRVAAGPAMVSCPVSRPNGGNPPGQAHDRWFHGTSGLWTVLWPGGTASVPAQNVERGGWLYVKVGWWRARGSYGRLRIQGHRLDARARALRADVPIGYGSRGLQVSAILFPTVGCWQVAGRSGKGRLTMVMRVVRTGR